MSENKKKFIAGEAIGRNPNNDTQVLKRIYIPETEERRRMERDRILYFES